MKRIPLKKLRLGSYLRELSIVIVGIGVTLYASNLVTSCNHRSDLNAQLHAVYAELAENRVKLDSYIEQLHENSQFRMMLLRYMNAKEEIPKDSVLHYAHLLDIDLPFGVSYKRAAYDLLCASGNILLMKDKQKLTDISDCYASLDIIKEMWQTLNSIKCAMIIELFRDTDFNTLDFNRPAWVQMRNFYASFGGGMNHAQETRKKINHVISE